MSKQDVIEVEGTIFRISAQRNVSSKLRNDHVILAHISGKIRRILLKFCLATEYSGAYSI